MNSVSYSDLRLAKGALRLRLAHPLLDALVVENVTFMTVQLEYLVLLFKLLEADWASLINIEGQVAEWYSLHLIDNIQAS